MYRIALNVSISYLRKHTRPGRETVQFDESQHDIAPEQSIAPKMEERLTMLRQVMVKCLPLDRALLLLYLDDRSYREIAAVLRLTETNVATKLSRLKERLGRFRSGLRPLVFGQTLQLIVGAVIIIIAADFWVRHLKSAASAALRLFLQAYGILFIAAAVRDLVLIR